MIVKCKDCDCDIYHNYTKNRILSINDYPQKNEERYMLELNQFPTESCNTSIYLTCEKGHQNKYYCKILNKMKNEKE